MLSFGLPVILAAWLSAVPASAAETKDSDNKREGTAGSAGRVDWKQIRYKGRSHVSFDQVAQFYGLKYVRNGRRVRLAGPRIQLEALSGSKGLILNGLRFYLSYPVLPWDDRVIVSNFDLANVIDATLRPSAQRDPAKLTTVIIDPAHGGRAAGVNGVCGVEKEVTLDLALKLRDQFSDKPLRVVLTREGDFDLSVKERLALAAAVEGEAVFVSLHLGDGNREARGLELFTIPPSGTPATYDKPSASLDDAFYPGNINDRENLALAAAIQGQALRNKLMSVGIKRARFAELKGIAIPAVYCRAGFVSNPEDAALLGKPEYLDKVAGAIAGGIERYARAIGKGLDNHIRERENDPLVISRVEVFADQVRSLDGEKRRVRVDIRSQTSAAVDPEKLELQVYFFDLVNGQKLDLSTADPPKVEWISVLPDWKATDTEVVEVTYVLPAMSAEEEKAFGQRFYYGFVVRLIYDGMLMDSYSEPTNLRRALAHFTPVFP